MSGSYPDSRFIRGLFEGCSRIALCIPPTSSSFAEVTAPRLSPSTLLAPLAEAGARWPLPSSLASLARPGQRRASLAQHGGARLPTLAAVCGETRYGVSAACALSLLKGTPPYRTTRQLPWQLPGSP
jgi:hypothetical protein